MKTATIRALRTQFPKVRRMLAQEGEIVVTERGRPVMLLRPYSEAAHRAPATIDYLERLRRRMPRALTAAQRRTIDEADRGER